METTTIAIPSVETPQKENRALVSLLQASEIYRDYQRAFQAITGLPLALRAAGSFQPPMQGSTLGNPLCVLLAGRNKTCAACLGMQEQLEQSAQTSAATSECFAGLNESAVPIRIGEQIVAYLQTGQILFQRPTVASARRAAARLTALDARLNPAVVEAAYRRSRVIERSHYDSMLSLLTIFAQQLSELSNQLMVKRTLTDTPVIVRARAFIAAHLGEDIKLAHVSQAVGMSPFYFCKTFKKGTGLTFTAYLSRVRIETVKQLLLNPYKRVSEAAYEAGFQSLSQFNRVFHRITGQSPTVYREQLHAPVRLRAAPQARVHAHAA
ncbi:MAG: helix-turn-helix domain-containing protein [Lacunisphaera sp.]